MLRKKISKKKACCSFQHAFFYEELFKNFLIFDYISEIVRSNNNGMAISAMIASVAAMISTASWSNKSSVMMGASITAIRRTFYIYSGNSVGSFYFIERKSSDK